MKEEVWIKAMFWALEHPMKYIGLAQCATVADAIASEYEARFEADPASVVAEFTLENPPSFDDLRMGCSFEGGQVLLDNMQDGSNLLGYTKEGSQDYAFHMQSGELSLLESWYSLNREQFLQDMVESINASEEL
jgi:hypothetical protein